MIFVAGSAVFEVRGPTGTPDPGFDWTPFTQVGATGGPERPGTLTAAVEQAVRETMGCSPQLSTTGGTSDGRFIAPTGAQVVELGVINATIHKVNECVRIDDVETLSRAYERIMELLLT